MRKAYLGTFVFLVLTASMASGCASRVCARRCKSQVEPFGTEAAVARLIKARMAEDAQKRPLEILALSGGGLNGAFGTGFLLGWRVNATDPRPRFDIVTGVSTGALQAPLIFLDTAWADRQLRHLYLTSAFNDLFCKRSPLTYLSTDSLYDHPGLVRKIWDTYDDPFIDKIAAESRRATAAGEPRLLFVASVNLDTGQTYRWNLTRMAERAASEPRFHERFRKAVLASAVQPIFLPPVEIDGDLHTDGGAREQVMVPEILETVVAATRRQAGARFDGFDTNEQQSFMPQSGGAEFDDEDRDVARKAYEDEQVGALHPHVHVIVNGEIGKKRICTQPNLLALTLRTVEVLVDEAIIGNLWRIWGTTMRNTGDLCTHCFRVVTMPHGILEGDASSLELDRKQMRRLLERGVEMGRLGTGWESDMFKFGEHVEAELVRLSR